MKKLYVLFLTLFVMVITACNTGFTQKADTKSGSKNKATIAISVNPAVARQTFTAQDMTEDDVWKIVFRAQKLKQAIVEDEGEVLVNDGSPVEKTWETSIEEKNIEEMPETEEPFYSGEVLYPGDDIYSGQTIVTAFEKLAEDSKLPDFEPGLYNFELELYTVSILSQTETVLNLTQAAKLEAKELVEGENKLAFNTKYSDSNGDLYVEFTWNPLINTLGNITKMEVGLFTVESDGKEAFVQEGISYDFESLGEIQSRLINPGDKYPACYLTYKASAIPAGEYYLKYKVYGQDPLTEKEILLNEFPGDLVKVNGFQTCANISFDQVELNSFYTVKYILEDGSRNSSETFDVTRNAYETVTLVGSDQINAPEGYLFKGWAECYESGKLKSSSEAGNPKLETKVSAGIKRNTWFKAIWEPITYTVSFNANGGAGEMKAQSFTYDADPEALSECTFEAPTGKRFGGWALSAEGEKVYDDKYEVSNLSSTNNAEIVLYAYWVDKEAHLIYYENLFDAKNSNPSFFKENDEVTLNEPGTRYGYTFGGWYTTDALEGTAITGWNAGEKTSDVTLYAKWTPNTNTPYTVQHWLQNVDDNNYTNVSDDAETKYGTTGATTNASAKKYEGFTAKTIQQREISADGKTVVIVYYDRNTITYTFEANGGDWGESLTETKLSGKYGAKITAPGDPTKEYYTFLGWATTENAEKQQFESEASFTLEESITLYAVWSFNGKVTLSIKDSAGNALNESYETIKDAVLTITAEPADAFIYYTKNGDDPRTTSSIYEYNPKYSTFRIDEDEPYTIKMFARKDGMVDSEVVTLNITFAKFTVTFELGETPTEYQENQEVTKTEYPGTKIMVPAYYWPKHTFKGWLSSETNEIVTFNSGCTVGKSDVIYTAQWEENGKTPNVVFSTVPETGEEVAKVNYNAQITLSCSGNGSDNVVIYYTTDETDPSESETRIQYNASTPIVITEDTVITAYAVNEEDDLYDSDLTSVIYKIKEVAGSSLTISFEPDTGVGVGSKNELQLTISVDKDEKEYTITASSVEKQYVSCLWYINGELVKDAAGNTVTSLSITQDYSKYEGNYTLYKIFCVATTADDDSDDATYKLQLGEDW